MASTRLGPGGRTSRAETHAPHVHVAGQVARATVGGTVTEQAREILERIERLLREAGTDKSRLLSANVWLSDMNSFAEMDVVWDAWVTEGQTPGRTTVESRRESPAHAVEIAVVASR